MRARIHNAAIRAPYLKHAIAPNSAFTKLGFLQPLSCKGFHRIPPQFRYMHVKLDEYMTHLAVNFHLLSMSCQETDAQTTSVHPGTDQENAAR